MRRCPEFVLLLMHVFHSTAYRYAMGSIRQIAGKGTRGLRTPRTVNTKHAQLYSSWRSRDDYFPIGDYDTFDGRSFASSDEEVDVKTQLARTTTPTTTTSKMASGIFHQNKTTIFTMKNCKAMTWKVKVSPETSGPIQKMEWILLLSLRRVDPQDLEN
jgi:hypothetical protein